MIPRKIHQWTLYTSFCTRDFGSEDEAFKDTRRHTAGFGDTREEERDIATAIALNMVVDSAPACRFAAVLNCHGWFAARAEGVRAMARLLTDFVENPPMDALCNTSDDLLVERTVSMQARCGEGTCAVAVPVRWVMNLCQTTSQGLKKSSCLNSRCVTRSENSSYSEINKVGRRLSARWLQCPC